MDSLGSLHWPHESNEHAPRDLSNNKVHLNYSGILEVTLFQYITSQKVIYQKQDVLNGIWSVQGV